MIDPENVRLEAGNFIILDHQHDKEPERNSTPSLSSLISILFPFICIPINDLLTAENVKLLIHPFIRPVDCTFCKTN